MCLERSGSQGKVVAILQPLSANNVEQPNYSNTGPRCTYCRTHCPIGKLRILYRLLSLSPVERSPE